MRPDRRSVRIAAAVAALLAVSPAAAGLLEGPLSAVFGTDAVPLCADPAVLAEVQERFAYGAVGMLRADIALIGFDRVRQTYPLETRPSPVARRYCAARGYLADGRPRHHTAAVYYLVEQRQGFAGLGWLVTACVNGYDRWKVNDGACRAVRRWW